MILGRITNALKTIRQLGKLRMCKNNFIQPLEVHPDARGPGLVSHII